MMTETTLDLVARLQDCLTTKQMTRLVKDMIAVDPNQGVASILQAIWKVESKKDQRRLEQLWIKWLQA